MLVLVPDIGTSCILIVNKVVEIFNENASKLKWQIPLLLAKLYEGIEKEILIYIYTVSFFKCKNLCTDVTSS